jgi:hypothetical protein
VPPLVSTGATIACTFGVAPMPLTTIPKGTPVIAGTPAGTIQDFVPMANIPSFVMCSAPSNPVVIAATAAKLGVFSPAPCVPATAAPWVPGATKVMIGKQPALHQGCQAMCTWGGVITISNPGNKGTVQVT